MTNEQIKQAQEMVNLLDQAASMTPVNRQSHVNIQLAAQFLRDLFNAVKPVSLQPTIELLPDPEKAN